MIVERIFPPDSKFYNRNRNRFSDFGKKLDAISITQLFSIWTLTVSGFVLGTGQENRFVYMDWTGWGYGLIKLIAVTVLFYFILKPKSFWIAGLKRLSGSEIFLHTFIALLLILIGWIDHRASIANFIGITPYIFAFMGCLFAFQVNLEYDETKGEWYNFDWDQKEQNFLFSTLSLSAAVILGFYFDDPIISTAGMVALPFPLITLIWPNRIRHLQRVRFYPLFIFAMFLCVRAPWFFIPIALLFYMLRVVNYFRYGIVYPSFGVDFSDDL